jgi:endo-1,3-1,4-beta-glycanase ExoK
MLAFVVATVLVPASAMGMASAELYRTQPYLYGRFDARIQFAPGDGVVSAFFLWKEGSDAANAYWNELDYEKIAADCHMQINNIYGNPKTQHQLTPSLSGICTGYHDYRFEWTPTYIAWVVDGKEIRRDTGANATAYAQNASAGMTIHFNIWPGNSSFGGNINNTTLSVHQYISWVQYSSYDNGNFTVQWREDFQTSGMPSGWAVGNWSSPFNLSTHNPQNVAFVNGIAVLSLTADNATGTPGTPPVDNATGGTGSGGSPSAGGATGSGGMNGVGGTVGGGGSTSSGGAVGTGGTPGSGGATGSGGLRISDAGIGSGGLRTSDAGIGSGGTTAIGGTVGLGGAGNSSGAATGHGGTSTSRGGASGGATGGGGSHNDTGGNSGTGGSSQSGSAGGASAASGGNGATTSVGPVAGSTGTNGSTSGGCSCSTTRAPGGITMSVAMLLGALALRRCGRVRRSRR